MRAWSFSFFFFFNDTATTEIYTLSLHDALPILFRPPAETGASGLDGERISGLRETRRAQARKSTRLNSSHGYISYAVFCLKKKKTCAQYSTRDTRTHTQPTQTDS